MTSGPSYVNKNTIIVDPSPKPSGISSRNRVEKRLWLTENQVKPNLITGIYQSSQKYRHQKHRCQKYRYTRNTGIPEIPVLKIPILYRYTSTRNTDTKNSDTRNTGTGNTDTRNSDTRNTGTGKTDTRNTDTRNSNTRNTGSRNTDYSRNIPMRSKSRVIILGDSIIKHLNPRQFQSGINRKVAIKTFSGA